MWRIILTLVFTTNLYASIIPKNHLSIPSTIKANISELEFNHLIQKTLSPYQSLMTAHYGATEFEIIKLWEDGTVNTATGKKDGKFLLKVYGGLARHPLITPDAFTMILCHEIGHLIGGAPTWKPFNQASSEGQADYFATNKCFKKINENEDLKIPNDTIPTYALNKCQKSYRDPRGFNLCKRSALAQLSLISLMHELSGHPTRPKFETPDPYEMSVIQFNGYPKPQCRLDTLLAGSLCHSDINELHDMNLYNKGNCATQNGDTEGLRPRCWYKERDDI